MSNKRQKPTQQSPSKKYSSTPDEFSFVPPVQKEDVRAREYQIDKKNSPAPTHIGLGDIDEAILYYFNEVIQPKVISNNEIVKVPVLYGSPERWSNIQKDGALRDKTGKFIAPLLVFKRTSISKNRNLTSKIDSNNPQNFIVVPNTYTKENSYDNFSALNNRTPKKEYTATVVPDFLTLEYSCTIFTDYVEHMNKIIEGISYAEGTYWGDRSKFLFRSLVDSFSTATEVVAGSDRIVTSTFTLKLDGYVIPKVTQADMLGQKKFFSKSQVKFGLETIKRLEDM